MSTPILSICIPTYNRAQQLHQCLTSLFEQDNIDSLIDSFEVVISNNASTDETSTVITSFKERYPNIISTENSTNLGFDRNILKVVANASGTFCLTLGDDDGLLPGGLAHIIQSLESTDVKYFHLNLIGYDSTLTKPLFNNPARPKSADTSFAHLSDFVRSITNYSSLVGNFGGMSMQLFDRKIWNDYENKDAFIGTQAAHLFILLDAFKNYPFTLQAVPTLKTRNEGVRWDLFPGLETGRMRAESTAKTALWINNLYELNIPEKKILFFFLREYYLNTLKVFIKKILHMLGLRKYTPQ